MTAARERVSIATQLTIPHRGSCVVPDYRGAAQLPWEAGQGSSPSHGRGWARLAPGLRLGQVPARLPASPRLPRYLVCTHMPLFIRQTLIFGFSGVLGKSDGELCWAL